MDDFISNIELIDNSILITYYFTDKKIKIPYNNYNRLKILNNIKENKHLIKKELNYLYKFKHVLLLINFLNICFSTFIYLLNNNILINLLTFIFSFQIIAITFLLEKANKTEINNLNELLISTISLKLPNEEKYLLSKKIINFQEFKQKRNEKNIFNMYDYDYPGKDNTLNKDTKILEFKK